MSEAGPDQTNTGDLRKALQHAVCQIVWDQDRQDGARTAPSAIAALTELTFQYATKSLIPDLYAFSTHGNRKSTISPDDVALALRKLGPDRLESFKSEFCSNNGSKKLPARDTNASAAAKLGKKDNLKRSAAISGHGQDERRRKRNETDVLSLGSSSSSSSDEETYGHPSHRNKNRKRRSVCNTTSGAFATGRTHFAGSSPLHNKQTSAATSTTNTNHSTMSRTSNQRESLLNKFRIPVSTRNKKCSNKNLEQEDSSSSDCNDIGRLPMKPLVTTATRKSSVAAKSDLQTDSSPMLSLKRIQNRQQSKAKSTSSTHYGRNDPLLLDDDSDSTEDEDEYPNKKLTMPKSVHTNTVSHQTHQKKQLEIEADDDDMSERYEFDYSAGQGGNARRQSSTDDNNTNRESDGAKPQSQVAEALANLSSDSGMDDNGSENETEDELRVGFKKSASGSRNHPVIESDDEDD